MWGGVLGGVVSVIISEVKDDISIVSSILQILSTTNTQNSKVTDHEIKNASTTQKKKYGNDRKFRENV